MQFHFMHEVENLKTNLFKMASLVDEQVELAFNSLKTGNAGSFRNIKAKDKEIDAYDNLITTQCENILALFQPVAVDLRFVISSLLINNQLERCGDIAVNIAQRVKKTSEHHSLIEETQIIEMGNYARQMLKGAIDSFMLNNIEIANTVLESDGRVDRLNKQIFKILVEKMQTEPKSIEPCAHLIILTRQIERLADHATNIAENLVFYIDAKIIAHSKKLDNDNTKDDN